MARPVGQHHEVSNLAGSLGLTGLVVTYPVGQFVFGTHAAVKGEYFLLLLRQAGFLEIFCLGSTRVDTSVSLHIRYANFLSN